MLVDEIISKIQQDFLNLNLDETCSSVTSLSEEQNHDSLMTRDSSTQSSSVYTDCVQNNQSADAKLPFSDNSNDVTSLSSFDNDESFHECQETQEEKSIAVEIAASTENSEAKVDALPSIEIQIHQASYSIRKTLSNIELMNQFALNMHRIDKDVTRCDRNYWYFMSNDNLKKLKNIVYT